jgi:hypothetical protein
MTPFHAVFVSLHPRLRPTMWPRLLSPTIITPCQKKISKHRFRGRTQRSHSLFLEPDLSSVVFLKCYATHKEKPEEELRDDTSSQEQQQQKQQQQQQQQQQQEQQGTPLHKIMTNRFLKSLMKKTIRYRQVATRKIKRFEHQYVQQVGKYLREQQQPTVAEVLTVRKIAVEDKLYECEPFTTQPREVFLRLQHQPNDILFLEKWNLISEVKDLESIKLIQSGPEQPVFETVRQRPAVVGVWSSFTEMMETFLAQDESRTLLNMLHQHRKTRGFGFYRGWTKEWMPRFFIWAPLFGVLFGLLFLCLFILWFFITNVPKAVVRKVQNMVTSLRERLGLYSERKRRLENYQQISQQIYFELLSEGYLSGTDRPEESVEEVQAKRKGIHKDPEPLPIKLRQPEEVVKLAEQIEKKRGIVPDEDLVWASTLPTITDEDNLRARLLRRLGHPVPPPKPQPQPQSPQEKTQSEK